MKRMTWSIWNLTILLLLPHLSHAGLCRKWSEVKTEGHLTRKFIPEASGLAVSRQFPERVYWINDSGNPADLIVTDRKGSNIQKINLQKKKFTDTEALAVADCDGKSCLIVADVGDNRKRRKNVELIIYLEQDLKPPRAKPFRRVKFMYSDGPKDVEAMVSSPKGDLLFITKEISLLSSAQSFVYQLPKKDWLHSGEKFLIAKKLGALPIHKWLKDQSVLSAAVTDAAFNAQRSVLGILTYAALIEIKWEKMSNLELASMWTQDVDWALVPIESLDQQETLAYAPKEDRVMWSSEFFAPKTPIFSMTCLESAN